jgi:hypothetical protein
MKNIINNISADQARIKIASYILDQPNCREDQREKAYSVISDLCNPLSDNYEKNINYLDTINRQIALNVILKRSIA